MEQEIIHHGISLYELLTACGVIIGGGIAQWVHMKITLSQLKSQIDYLEKRADKEEEDNKDRQTRIYGKLDSISKDIEEIKINIASIKK